MRWRDPGRSVSILVAVVVLGALLGPPAALGRAPRLNLVPDGGVQGKLGLFMDGRFAGIVDRIVGCGMGAVVVGPTSWDSTDLRLGARIAGRCEIHHGRLSKSFMLWLSASLGGTARPTTLRLASYKDGVISQPLAAVELRDVRLSRLELPRIDRNQSVAAPFRTVLIASQALPVSAAGNAAPNAKVTKLWTDQFTLSIDDVVQTRTSMTAPFVLAALFGPGQTEPTGPDAGPGVFHASDLVMTAIGSGRRPFDAWLRDVLDGAREPERRVTIRYLDGAGATLLTATLEGVAMAGADAGLHPTQRTYAFYVESVALAYP